MKAWAHGWCGQGDWGWRHGWSGIEAGRVDGSAGQS